MRYLFFKRSSSPIESMFFLFNIPIIEYLLFIMESRKILYEVPLFFKGSSSIESTFFLFNGPYYGIPTF